MDSLIGELAGEVWNYLDDKGEVSVSSIGQDLDAPRTKVNMAIGWLACEGKLEFLDSGRGNSVKLK